MAQKSKKTDTKKEKEFKLFKEVNEHYQAWDEDNEKRRTRDDGWDDVTRAYWGELPEDWPYISRVSDPRIRTTILEKDARLLNRKPKGRVIPRGDGSNQIKSTIQNIILDLQWDNANHGGSMQEKLIISSQDARLYASKYAFVYWKEEKDEDGNLIFSGNEMKPLDIRDCGMDPKAGHIRDAKWFQHRDWFYIEDLEAENDLADKKIWKNLNKVKTKMNDDEYKVSDRRDNTRSSEVLGIQGLTDRVGEDRSFPVLEVVTEYRKNKWVSIATRYNEIVRETDNPFDHGKIPISQLRYYPIQDDHNGESEVESVMPLWRAIQATICGYLDEMVLKMRPPLKIIENAVRIETIQYGPEAQWLMDDPDAVTEMRGSGEAQRWFQTTYQSLVSAFNTAMGDLSQGISSIEMFSSEKTATEIRQSAKQQNARDQRNQNELDDFIKDIMMMWISNNKQFYFTDEDRMSKILHLAGIDEYAGLQNLGLADMELPDESMDMLQGVMEQTNYEMPDAQLREMAEAASVPTHPYVENPDADPADMIVKPKLEIDEKQKEANLYLTPEDLDGDYNYIVDVKSMEAGSGTEYVQSRQQALEMMKDESLQQLLFQEGFRPKVKDLIVDTLNGGGFNDSQKYFEKIEEKPAQGQPGAQQGTGQASQKRGLPTTPAANPEVGGPQPMAGPQQF